MGECPAGQELRIALGNMACRSCGCQCIIRYLEREVKNLSNENSKLKIDIDDLDYEISKIKKR